MNLCKNDSNEFNLDLVTNESNYESKYDKDVTEGGEKIPDLKEMEQECNRKDDLGKQINKKKRATPDTLPERKKRQVLL